MSLQFQIQVGSGMFGEKYLTINEDHLTYHDMRMDLKDIVAFRYGAISNQVNYIEIGISYMVEFLDSACDKTGFSMGDGLSPNETKGKFEAIVDAIWKYFGHRITEQIIKDLSEEKDVIIGHLIVSQYGIAWKHKPLFGKEQEHKIAWKSIHPLTGNGTLILESVHDRKIKTSLNLVSEFNAVVLLHIMRLIKTDPNLINHISGLRH